ncbi:MULTISPECIES: response regulator transcription factor [Gammaproteobacteria]|uniref:response regulator transcription factor n=1 Tax=Gammaproteobacteria TaxID=1236 RepID=UPI0035621E78
MKYSDKGQPLAGQPLSPCQLDVLFLIGQGYSNKEAARALDKSMRTVDTQLQIILAKLEAENRTNAVYIAAKRGLI